MTADADTYVQRAALVRTVRTPNEYREAVRAAETLGLALVNVDATDRYGWELHPSVTFDAWHPRGHRDDLTVEPGVEWFTVTDEDGEAFRVRPETPGRADDDPAFALAFEVDR